MITALALSLGLAACGSDSDNKAGEQNDAAVEQSSEDTESASEDVSSEEEKTSDEAARKPYNVPDTIKFDGNFTLNVLGYEYFDTGDEYEYNIVNVYYDITNDSTDDLRSPNAVCFTATQDGEELEGDPNSNITYGNMEFNDNIWLRMQPGVTTRGVYSFACKKNSDSIITIGAGDSSDNFEYFEVDPTWEMPDMRSEKYEMAKVADPSYGPGDLESGSYEGRYDVSVKGIVGYSTDEDFDRHGEFEEHRIVGIQYSITNNKDEADSPFMLCMNENFVFQDGISLMQDSAGKESEDHGKTQDELPLYQDIQPGQSIDFTVYYKLRSDSPIEVVFRQFVGGTIFVDKVYDIE